MNEKKIRTIFLHPLLLPLLHLIHQTPFSGIPTTFAFNLARCFATVFTIQTVVALPSVLLRNELFYDVAGAGSFLTVVLGASLGAGYGGDWRQRLVSGAVAVWAGRCRFGFSLIFLAGGRSVGVFGGADWALVGLVLLLLLLLLSAVGELALFSWCDSVCGLERC
jgi:hypothetical protein